MITNIVDQSTLREVQLETLKTISDALTKSFGPFGSNTIIFKEGALPRYTKDGHTILGSIQFSGPIEKSVHADIEEETRTQAVKVGDSTTSITMLSYRIFDYLCRLQNEFDYVTPAAMVRTFKDVADQLKERIKSKGRPIEIEDIYNIALISTNNNVKLSKELANVYEEFGKDVYIDVKASLNGTTYLKEINGMNLECGFLDPTLINDAEKNVCAIQNPRIYAFKDPIDSIEMGMFLDTILSKNILEPIRTKNVGDLRSTVIIAPKISRDYSAYMGDLMNALANTASANRGFLNIITDITGADIEQYEDICDLCGCKYIKKYLDPEIQKSEIEAGLAPTPETVCDFYGTAELVSSDAYKTTFVNPKFMYQEDGVTPTPLFEQRLDYLNKQIQKLEVEGNNTTDIYTLKKRLHSLKGKMVEIYIGGVTVADRDADRDLMEDAVLSCRSAALSGVGYAANFEGLRAVSSLLKDIATGTDSDKTNLQCRITEAIYNAYMDVTRELYHSIGYDEMSVNSIIEKSLTEKNCPMNIVTGYYDGKVLTSIDTDVCIIDTISKIITIMATSNQFLLPTLNANQY